LGGLQHTLTASPAAVPRTHDALNPVLHRKDVEGFLDGLPDLVQPLAAAGADVALDIDQDIDARQMLRKLAPVASRRSLSTALRSVRQAASGHVVVGRGTSCLCRDGEERQLSGIQCLGAGTEDRALVLGQDTMPPKLQCIDGSGPLRPGTVRTSHSELSRFAAARISRFSTVRACARSARLRTAS
jgi:hypothetical protein